MAEKKLSGFVVKMIKPIRAYNNIVYILILAILLGCAVLPCFVPAANAAVSSEIPPGVTMPAPEDVKPVLAGIQVSQWGGSMLRLRIRGFELPFPQTASAPGDARLVLRWDGVRFPKSTDKRDWWDEYGWDVLNFRLFSSDGTDDSWWKQYDTPLLNRINVQPADEDSINMTFITTRPMIVDSIEGVPGADELMVLLKIDEPQAPLAPPEPPRVHAEGDPMGISAPVTLQVRDARLRVILEMFADMHRVNLFIDPSVPDTDISFSFNDVPFNEAFRMLLVSNELEHSFRNGILSVAKPENLMNLRGDAVTRVYKLSYAIDRESGELRSDVKAALENILSLPEDTVVDVAMNRELYVRASPERHREIAEVLERLDRPGRQVMLEARIFRVANESRQELEAIVNAVYDTWRMNIAGGLNFAYDYVDLVSNVNRLQVELNAMERNEKGKTIASPSLITLDGQIARIDLQEEVTYVSGRDENGNLIFSTVNGGPSLEFLPVIGRDGVITINTVIYAGGAPVFTEQPDGIQIPRVANRTVETYVRVRNGEPFVVGGLYQDQRVQNRIRIPVLGYIPYLGNMFSFRTENRAESEVAIIVIPYILDIPDASEIDKFDLRGSAVF